MQCHKFKKSYIATINFLQGAVNNSDDLRAVELASFMTEKALDVAVKYAMTQGRSHLADKLKSIKPVDWNNYYPVHSANQPSNEDADVRRFEVGDLNSQRDMFEESPQKVSRIGKAELNDRNSLVCSCQSVWFPQKLS